MNRLLKLKKTVTGQELDSVNKRLLVLSGEFTHNLDCFTNTRVNFYTKMAEILKRTSK